jgi:hypothetical protein
MKIYLLFFFSLLGCTLVQGQSVGLPTAGSRGMAMGGAAVCFQDVNALFSNPAGTALLPGWSATAFGEQRFLLSEIRAIGAGVALPSGFGSFGLTAQYFGVDAFNQQRLGLTYGRLLFDRLALGGGFHFWNTRINEYGSQAALSFEIGLQAQINRELWIGVHAYNPARVELADGELLPTILSVGLNYHPSSKLHLSGQVSKDIDQPIQFHGGVEYQVIDPLFLRAGFSTQPTQGSFGVALQLGQQIRLDFSSRFHTYLGWSPGFGIVFQSSGS